MSKSERRPAILIEAHRSGYNPDQVEHGAMTVADLIDALTEMGEEWGMDTKVFLRHDRGYTYGGISWDDINHAEYDGDRVYDGEEW